MDKIKVMIVEDESDVSEVYKIKLEKEWIETLVCEDWLTALSKVIDFKPDLILLDIMMPWMDGFDVLKVIKEQTSGFKTKIIIFSNLSSKTEIDKWVELWADLFLVKANTTPKEALEKIKELLWQKNIDKTHTDIEQNKTQQYCCPHCNKEIKITIK